jgi:hypothetical protein
VTGRKIFRCLAALAALGCATAAAQNNPTPSPALSPVLRAQNLWSKSPHGAMLERILPPSVEPRALPEPDSEGARLTVRYCVQCHYLPSPQMHTPERWTTTVVRMVWRMQGKGNMGSLMREMMDKVEAPTDAEVVTVTRYLQKHGQREMDPGHPGLSSEPGKMFAIACTQCHALPDPRRHTAREWPAVVERMKRHMLWANTVVGPDELKTTPTLQTDEIVRFLQRYARAER